MYVGISYSLSLRSPGSTLLVRGSSSSSVNGSSLSSLVGSPLEQIHLAATAPCVDYYNNESTLVQHPRRILYACVNASIIICMNITSGFNALIVHGDAQFVLKLCLVLF